jgi:hypothetical protein
MLLAAFLGALAGALAGALITLRVTRRTTSIVHDQVSPTPLDGTPMLRVLDGPKRGETIPLTRSPISIGRDATEAAFVLPGLDDTVSKRHCSIGWDDEHQLFTIADDGSRNGTMVDGTVFCVPGELVLATVSSVVHVGSPKLRVRLEFA